MTAKQLFDLPSRIDQVGPRAYQAGGGVVRLTRTQDRVWRAIAAAPGSVHKDLIIEAAGRDDTQAQAVNVHLSHMRQRFRAARVEMPIVNCWHGEYALAPGVVVTFLDRQEVPVRLDAATLELARDLCASRHRGLDDVLLDAVRIGLRQMQQDDEALADMWEEHGLPKMAAPHRPRSAAK